MDDFQKILASPVLTWQEGMNFFQGKGMLNNTLHRLVADLEKHGIDYNLIGAVALNQHGYPRFTVDIDLLLSPEGLQTFQAKLVGRGYRPTFEGAQKKFRSTQDNVPIEIILTGEYPGDGKPKPVQFHHPSDNFVIIEGIKTVNLVTLINLKLASGLTAPGRLKDLADIEELIKIKGLDESFAEHLNPFVQEKFVELARGVRLAREQENI
jgi:hypothetical protein